MLVFIDESGDPGFKLSKGASAFFVVALVIFEDQLDAEETALKIKRHMQFLRKSSRFEFKFNKSNHQHRLGFLQAVADCAFKVRAIVVDKEVIYSQQLREHKGSFYNYFLRMVLERNNDAIRDAKIRLDSSGEKAMRRELQTYLRQNLNSHTKKVMKNLRFRDSQKDVLIQLADMVAGAIRKKYENYKSSDKEYYSIIKQRVHNIWEFK